MTWPLVIQYIHYMQAWPFEPRTRASPRALIRRDAHLSTRHHVCCESIKSCVNSRIYPTKNVRIARKERNIQFLDGHSRLWHIKCYGAIFFGLRRRWGHAMWDRRVNWANMQWVRWLGGGSRHKNLTFKRLEFQNLCLIIELLTCIAGCNSAVERSFS